VLVEREIGDEPLQLIVFVLEQAQTAQLSHGQIRVLSAGREGGFADTELTADIADRCSGIGLAQCVGDQLLGEFRPLRWSPPWRGGPPKPSLYSSFDLPSFSGRRSPQFARPLASDGRATR
jgi:hypothetical protein